MIHFASTSFSPSEMQALLDFRRKLHQHPELSEQEQKTTAQIRAALGAPDAPVVATGTLPDSVRTACATDIVYRETLVLEGLYWIWKKNTRK